MVNPYPSFEYDKGPPVKVIGTHRPWAGLLRSPIRRSKTSFLLHLLRCSSTDSTDRPGSDRPVGPLGTVQTSGKSPENFGVFVNFPDFTASWTKAEDEVAG